MEMPMIPWILLMSLLCAFAQSQDKPPLTVSVQRSWKLAENTSVGSLVAQAFSEPQGDDIIFGLEHATGFNIYQSSDLKPLPFVINPKTGYIYTNQTLSNLGDSMTLYVTAEYNDSSISLLTSKVQIFVRIDKQSKKSNTIAVNQNFRGTPVNYPGYGIDPSELPWKKNSTKLNNVNNASLYSPPSSSTSTESVSKSSVLNEDESSHFNVEQSTRTKTEEPPLNNSKNVETVLIPSREPNGGKLIIALIPTIVIFTSLFISGVIACLFRKKICKKRNKIKKDDMKKSSCSVLSLEESMVMHHCRGVCGLSNECDSWDSESHNQSTMILNKLGKMADKWEIPRHRIKVFNILGEGCFGQVWKCEAMNIDNKEGPTVVAVKMLKENAGEQERSDLVQELQVMKMLDPHPNVVRLLGCCTEKDPIFVIMEYVPNGKLQSYLRHSRAQHYYDNMHGSSNTLTSRDLTLFCYQIAKGMQYLSSKGIIHRDLAARNILVGENNMCKVADFGFARDIMTQHVYERKSEGRLPIRWMAPESLFDNMFSVKSDIWSFGVLVWEIVTLGSTPYPKLTAAEVMSKVREGYRLEKPEHCRRELYNIMYYCWDEDPNKRPTFMELVDLLEQLLLTETDYILLERCPDHSYYNTVPLSGEKL
ncbi:tyrosine kinase receptor Cad96Ca [Planococcus citri]|uniref:tyrosine kinase receptor Cad96Ca n=1 Tax=Planococcus citri TaxID=170843 RepID=UPI0031F9C954